MHDFVSIQNIRNAARIIGNKIHRTPLDSSRTIGEMCRMNLSLKLELFQKTGSFKPRGVLTKLHFLTEDEKKQGVISLSAGNHAQAVAWASTQMGIKSTIIMPRNAYKNKVEATRNYGGEVILTSENLLDTCLTIQKERHLVLLHPFDDPAVISGQGTVGLEIMEDCPHVEVVIVAIGGGGLISGTAAAIKQINPEVKVYGVEPTGSNVMTQSLRADRPVSLESNLTIADGLAAPFAGKHTLDHVRKYVDEVICVSDEAIVDSMVLLMERAKVFPEPSGAASLAALLSGKLPIPQNSQVVLVVCGGNIEVGAMTNLIKGEF